MSWCRIYEIILYGSKQTESHRSYRCYGYGVDFVSLMFVNFFKADRYSLVRELYHIISYHIISYHFSHDMPQHVIMSCHEISYNNSRYGRVTNLHVTDIAFICLYAASDAVPPPPPETLIPTRRDCQKRCVLSHNFKPC